MPPHASPLPAGVGGGTRFWHGLSLVGLAVATVLFRLPALLNAAAVHSDTAIVGLQARHILRGEWSWFLWGDGQQSSFDALMVAVGFVVAGDRPRTLMAVPLAGHLLLTWFVWDILRKRVGGPAATVAALPIVLGPPAIAMVALYAPRQWCFTAAAAGFWLLDGAARSRRPVLRYALGGAVAVAAASLDLIAAAFVPAVLAFAVACSLDGSPPAPALRRRLLACGVGLGVGAFLVWLPRQGAESSTRKAGTSLARVPSNARLLGATALPWTLSAKVLALGPTETSLRPLDLGPAFRVVQAVGAGSMALGILSGGLAGFGRRLPWEVRRTGLLGAAVTAGVLAAYLVSVMPVDAWSVRYLGPIIWSAPLALAPAAYRLGASRLAIALGPYLIAAAANGWLFFDPFLQGGWPIREARGVAADEARLGEALAGRGVRFATANYWLAYRLTYLLRERLIVTPLSSTDVRYGPYVQGFQSAPIVAYLFHPSVPAISADAYEADLRAAGTPLERLEVAGFTAIVLPSTTFRYRDPEGEGRLALRDLGPGAGPGTHRQRATLVRDGLRSEGPALLRELERDRPFATALSFTLDGPLGHRVYEGRMTSPFVPIGQGTYHSAGAPGTGIPWSIARIDRN